MKHKSKTDSKRESHFGHDPRENAEVAEFHTKRMFREEKIEAKKESRIRPQGNDEYEQLIAEEACFNAKPMIEEAAFYIAELRGFAPGHEMADWLQAEASMERLLRNASADECRKPGVGDRRI